MKYAQGTTVSVEKSKAEIESLVRRYGADGFISGWNNEQATIQFRCQGRHIRFIMKLPDRRDKRFTHQERYAWKERSEAATLAAWEQACRQKWRSLALLVKAKLEAIDSGIATFEEEFLANIVMPGGKTVHEWTRDSIKIAYERGDVQPMLPDLR
jgi:hypothetical protein